MSNAIDRIATGESFESSREELQAALREYEERYGPLVTPCHECDFCMDGQPCRWER